MPDNETQRSGLPFNEKSLTLFNQSVSSWVMIGTPVRKGGRTSLSPAPKNRPDYYHPVKTIGVSSHGFQRSVPTNMIVLKVSSFGRRKSKVLGPSYWVQMWPWISGHRSRLGFVGCCARAGWGHNQLFESCRDSTILFLIGTKLSRVSCSSIHNGQSVTTLVFDCENSPLFTPILFIMFKNYP